MAVTLNINGHPVAAQSGDTLVDAALGGGILIPHDCATGQCETCRVRIAAGLVEDAGSRYGDSVLACQARIAGDLAITFEEAPAPVTERGTLEAMRELGGGVVEMHVRITTSLPYRPGQYAKLTLAGFPAREYSFTNTMDGRSEPDLLVFQIKQLRDGVVSSQLGKTIRIGHKAKVAGPFGSAFLRQQETGPLVLAASGTGFAPIWSLARAATLTGEKRPISIVAGAKTCEGLYMQPAIDWLRDHGQNDITLTTRHPNESEHFVVGEPDSHLPKLDKTKSVHVAGNPALVNRVRQRALEAHAQCYADPFTPSRNTLALHQRLRAGLSRPTSVTGAKNGFKSIFARRGAR